MTDIPLPRQSNSSSRMRSRTGSGRVAGPALKLKMRLVVGREAVGELTVKDPLELGECDSGAIRPAFITQQNSRNPGTYSIGQIIHGFARSGNNHDWDTEEYDSQLDCGVTWKSNPYTHYASVVRSSMRS